MYIPQSIGANPEIYTLGSQNSYCGQVCARITNGQVFYVNSFEKLFALLEDGVASYILVAYENTTTSGVQNLSQLLSSSVAEIIGKYSLPIRHQFIVNRGAKIEGIKAVYTHPQAALQCWHFLRDLGVEIRHTSSTDAAIKEMDGKHGFAAIASKDAVGYSQEILFDHAQILNLPDENETRFYLLARPTTAGLRLDQSWRRAALVLDTIEGKKHRSRFAINEVVGLMAELNIRTGSDTSICRGADNFGKFIEIHYSENFLTLLEAMESMIGLNYRILGQYDFHELPLEE